MNKSKSAKLLALVFGFSVLSLSALPALADDMLKGGVEETGVAPVKPEPINLLPMPVPVVPKLEGNANSDQLKGGTEQNDLTGGVNDEGGGDLKPGQGKLDKRKQPLQGSAAIDDSDLAAQDPDVEDQELMVEWDKWRNRFLWAVQSGVQEVLNNPDESMLRFDPNKNAVVMRFPLGTTAWFACKVTPDRRVVSLKLMKSSGFPGFDDAVLQSVRNLEGTSILRYPKRSRRRVVSQVAGIKTSSSSEQQYFHFGDTERVRVPGGQ